MLIVRWPGTDMTRNCTWTAILMHKLRKCASYMAYSIKYMMKVVKIDALFSNYRLLFDIKQQHKKEPIGTQPPFS